MPKLVDEGEFERFTKFVTFFVARHPLETVVWVSYELNGEGFNFDSFKFGL